MKLFKLIASRAGQVLFDDRVEADSPREAREQMKALMGLNSLTGVVYAITEIPVELIQSIVDARLVEALQRLRGGQAPATVEQMLRPIASEAVREQLATLRTVQTAEVAPPATPQRFDAFTHDRFCFFGPHLFFGVAYKQYACCGVTVGCWVYDLKGVASA